MEKEWSALVVLDACRLDAMQEVKDEYDFLPEEIPSVYSRGTYSKEWLQENFEGKFTTEKAETLHITGNPFTEYVLDEEEWYYLDEVWRTAWDEKTGTILPRSMTDRAIHAGRSESPGRMLVHYMQPHTPYQSLEAEGERDISKYDEFDYNRLKALDSERETVWDLLSSSEISRQEAWEAYVDNLRWVLDDVEILLNNLDAERVVLTADHGDLFGEWSLYGHPHYIRVPELVKVPWVEVTADDRGSTHRTSPKKISSVTKTRPSKTALKN